MTHSIRDEVARVIWQSMSTAKGIKWSDLVALSASNSAREPVHRAFAAADKIIEMVRKNLEEERRNAVLQKSMVMRGAAPAKAPAPAAHQQG